MKLKLYVITLQRSPERKRGAAKNLSRFNIDNYEFIYGLDALQYSEQQLNHLLDKKNLVKPLPRGMIGCCISHVKALRRFVGDESATHAVIMEDDFLLHDNLNIILSEIEDQVLNSGPVMLYGYVTTPLSFHKQSNINAKYTLYTVEKPLNVYSTLGYMVNKQSAKALLKVLYPIKDVADSWNLFHDLGGFKQLYIIYPFLLTHEVFDSSRVQRKQSIADWIIEKKVPFLYQLIRKKRIKYVESHTNLISFKE
jgi:glycosyl transferase family 25